MIFLLLLLQFTKPPAPTPGPGGSDPRYINRYFQSDVIKGSVPVPKSGIVRIPLPKGVTNPATCILLDGAKGDFISTDQLDHQTLRTTKRGLLRYKCTIITRRHPKAFFYQEKWVCEPGWRAVDEFADKESQQPCIEDWIETGVATN